jgi:hypothetical protein
MHVWELAALESTVTSLGKICSEIGTGSLVKRAALLKKIKGGARIPIPRHVEIDDNLAEQIFKECEPELGERWWKR